ncbi:hypothetical protein AYJ54_44120 [Bradyrhizobium centrolobii]|uniref:Uncharacterized protein n=1 Tax=Bradyrhizobium centrolobii TaxID=1505087 RepID=A0A176Z1W8_9BRAD|nr:hypothetical protein [Bradyrhizobium centrolobii]OAF13326.1 hypothetical protein AYJ54_44120 [Bradyrhizobium centrolobii]
MESMQTPPADGEQQSIGQLAICALVFLCTAIPIALLLRAGWRDWTLFAGVWTAMYFMGGARWFPWSTPLRKAISIGVFVGTALPTIEWVSSLKH